MTNRNKKIVKKVREQARKKTGIKTIINIIDIFIYNFAFFLVLICYPIAFLLLSFLDKSELLSFVLAIFSFFTTLCFELLEWANLTSKTKSKNKFFHILQKIFKHKNIVMLMIPGLFTISMIFLCIINIPKINPYLPNIITAVTFIIYFSVFYKRSFYQKKNIH